MNKLITSIVLCASVAAVQLPISFSAEAAGLAAQEEKKKRKTYLPSPNTGKKAGKAFEAYSADDIDGALAILLEIDTSKTYDRAYIDRFIAVMYATKGNHEKDAIKYLKQAVEPDVLNEKDQAESLKLLGDLLMATKDYKGAIENYYAWMDFTGETDANVWLKVANAQYTLKALDKVIGPADKAIAAFGDKPNQNPYILKVTSYYERKMFKEAIDVLETAVQVFPEMKVFWVQLGQFYTLVEDYPKALATLDLAYKQGFLEKESEIKVLASLFAQSDIPYKSAALLEKHIEAGDVQRDDKNLSAMANAWHAALHISKAAGYYSELAKMTNKAEHYRRSGSLYKQDEQFKKAIVNLNKALELGVKNEGRVLIAIAESHFYLEQFKQAYAAIKKAEKDPKSRKMARAWVSHIKDTADRKGKSI
jgi:tetratricopeptide (TPR) repeat protein